MGPVSDKQEKTFDLLDRDIKRIAEMVRHYLNLSRIENNELMPVTGRVVLLRDIVEPAFESIELELLERGMRLDRVISGDLLLDVDLNMVREVFDNLLSNAVKYGREDGVITVSAEMKNGMVEVRVRNEGVGIPEDQVNLVFGKFSRLRGTDFVRKGSGLGLFITRNIVMAHGGDIAVKSSPGEWVEFAFTLPAYV